MQEAYSVLDGTIYTALQIEQFIRMGKSSLPKSFRCNCCGEISHYRSRSSDGRRSPCFYCLPHGENCEITRQNSDPWGDDDESRINHAGSNGGRLVVQILGESLEDLSVNGAVDGSDHRTRSTAGGARSPRTDIQRGPQRILELLSSSNTFRTSPTLVRFRDGSELPVHSAFVEFRHADYQIHTDHWQGFWGVLPYPSYWAYGSSYYFNFGSNDADFRISVSEQHASEIIRRHGLNSVTDMSGCLFILFDIARISNSGRFTADVISPNHVGLIKLSP